MTFREKCAERVYSAMGLVIAQKLHCILHSVNEAQVYVSEREALIHMNASLRTPLLTNMLAC